VPIKLETGVAGTTWDVVLRTYTATTGLNFKFSNGAQFSKLSCRGKCFLSVIRGSSSYSWLQGLTHRCNCKGESAFQQDSLND
jgi:hypothetical protein